ncbi:snake venom metalloproteinase H2 [Lepeophtheirus salmonis]|uniref:snake venom metalloproteinase H2 n=1 Tax=Lepeophtheirus salmonis TaxID=72036 RepID=UPI001AE7C685|nr:snake venom metalloproteinase H4-like [Lepeophtheirus salmonis]
MTFRIASLLYFIYSISKGLDHVPPVTITWKGNITRSSIPPMRIHFTNEGRSERIHLKRRHLLTSYDDLCSFQGDTAHKTTFVTVSGCPHEEFHVFIRSKGHNPIIAAVKSGVTTFTKPNNVTVSSIIKKFDSGFGYLVHQSENATEEDVPNKLYLRLAVTIDSALKKYFDFNAPKAVKEINQIMLHCEGLFQDGSLGTNIVFQQMTLYDESNFTSVGFASENNLQILGPHVTKRHKKEFFHHFVHMTHDSSKDGVLGMSYIGQICSQNASLRTSIIEYNLSPLHTALVLAHEIGHNLGLVHDSENCVGIMYPLIIGSDVWSNCSRRQLKGFYNSILKKHGSFCLEEGSGVWSKWTSWSKCNVKCNRVRTRHCEMNVCRGEEKESMQCDPCLKKWELNTALRATPWNDYKILNFLLEKHMIIKHQNHTKLKGGVNIV